MKKVKLIPGHEYKIRHMIFKHYNDTGSWEVTPMKVLKEFPHHYLCAYEGVNSFGQPFSIKESITKIDLNLEGNV